MSSLFSPCVEVRGQLTGVSSCLPSCGHWGVRCSAWEQAPLLAYYLCWPNKALNQDHCTNSLQPNGRIFTSVLNLIFHFLKKWPIWFLVTCMCACAHLSVHWDQERYWILLSWSCRHFWGTWYRTHIRSSASYLTTQLSLQTLSFVTFT